jgi:hypothetical protein
MSSDLEQLRRTVPDLAHVDPLSREVHEWLDRACTAVRQVDAAEAVILGIHQRYLLDPTEKVVAAEEIVASIDRAIRTGAILRRAGVPRRRAA